MKKIFIFAPDKQDVIETIVDVASRHGAGVIGNYTHCHFVTKGMGNWKAQTGALPTIGGVGEYSHVPEVKIEMLCPDNVVLDVVSSIRAVHPYEEPEIDVMTIDMEK